MAHVAKNVVASGLADRCELQLAYAIGVCSRSASTSTPSATGQIPDTQIAELVRKTFPMTPSGIIDHLKLLPADHQKTASGGHLRPIDPSSPGSGPDKADALRQAAGLTAGAV